MTDKIETRNKDRNNAAQSAKYTSAEGKLSGKELLTGVADTNSKYMQSVGKEGLKIQQEHMRAKADDIQNDYTHHINTRQNTTAKKYKGASTK